MTFLQCKYFTTLGVFLFLTGSAIIVLDPLSMIIKDQFRIKPGKYLFNLFENPEFDILANIYVFNITNTNEFLSGVDKKLKMKETGPYVLREAMKHKNLTVNANGTVSYILQRTQTPVPEKSIGDTKKDKIFAPNLIFLGASSVAAQHSKVAAVGFKVVANSLDSQPILNMSVHDYLWGYEDKLLKLASNILPSLVKFERFGFADRIFDEGENLVTVHLPDSSDLFREIIPLKKAAPVAPTSVNDVEYEDIINEESTEAVTEHVEENFEVPPEVVKKSNTIRSYSIDSWNGSPMLPHFEHLRNHPDEKMRQCARLQGGFDGSLFFKNVSKFEKLRVFRRAHCRLVPIYFTNATKIFGLNAYNYEISENAFFDSLDDPDTCCFCRDGKTCLKKGLGNISPCYLGIPIAVSQPHFYNGDPSLLEEVEGLSPEKARHQTVIAIQPDLGIPMRVSLKIQLNLVTGDLSANDRIKRFGNTVLPIVWLDFDLASLSKEVELLLKLGFVIMPYVQVIVAVAFIITGACIVIAAFVPKKEETPKDIPPTEQPLLLQK